MTAGRRGADDGDPHATELAGVRETGEQHLIVVTVLCCQHCGASLPPDGAQCDGTGEPRGAQIAMEEITWRMEDGREIRSKVPRACLERHRDGDGRVRWPRAA